MAVDDEQLVASVTKAPSLLQHAPADIAEKVGLPMRPVLVS
jgi:hypothetical protein